MGEEEIAKQTKSKKYANWLIGGQDGKIVITGDRIMSQDDVVTRSWPDLTRMEEDEKIENFAKNAREPAGAITMPHTEHHEGQVIRDDLLSVRIPYGLYTPASNREDGIQEGQLHMRQLRIS